MLNDIDFVLPCYNPPPDFVGTVDLHFRKLKDFYPDRRINLIVVNDGSTRNFTSLQINQLRSLHETIKIIFYSPNKGKGYALRKAIADSSSPLVVYTDCDFPYSLESITELIGELDKGVDIVLASRNYDYSQMLSVTRKFFSWLSKRLNRTVLKMKHFETQGGLKGFNLKGKEIFMSTTINGFLFDTEFVYKASLQKDISIVSIKGIIRKEIKLSRITIRSMINELINFYRIAKIKA